MIGFGTFETRDRAAEKAETRKPGEMIKIPACKAPAFKAGKGTPRTPLINSPVDNRMKNRVFQKTGQRKRGCFEADFARRLR